ncbi:MAG TPA: cellulose biosynthesis cyclic di-GMP-binding regulatory protein BcsB, partial [Acetobacteraceae bacterium]|nr:cellulose biosynthesis cyclic di-GMP-binding regulatory protein BcsB [Acetobacteraceae bacterium]
MAEGASFHAGWGPAARRMFGLAFLLLAVMPRPAAARGDAGSAAIAPRPLATEAAPLSWFVARPSQLALPNPRDSRSIALFVPPNRRIVRARLHLSGTNSAALPDRSSLLVSLNGSPVQQIALSGAAPAFDGRIALPAALFRPGRNELTFSAIQPPGVGCGGFSRAAPWASMAGNSAITVTYRAAGGPPALAQLPDLFGRSLIPGDSRLMILYDKALARSPEPIMAAAQSVALLAGRRHPIRVTAHALSAASLRKAAAFPGRVIVLKLAPKTGSGLAGGHARLRLADNTAGGAMLSVTAGSPATLAHAATLIAAYAFAWPDAPEAVIDLAGAHRQGYQRLPQNRAAQSVTFGEAGVPTGTRAGPEIRIGPVAFWNPNWNSHGVLYLHLAYSAGIAPGSVVRILVNGTMAGTVPLPSVSGGTYPDYRFLISGSAIRIGENELALAADLAPAHPSKAACGGFGPDSSALTIFSDSRIAIIGGAPVVPNNLAAIAAGAYPVHLVALPDPSSPAISAAATFGAKLAQVTGHGGLGMVSAMPAHPPAGTVVVAITGRLPAALRRRSRLIVGHQALYIKEQPLSRSLAGFQGDLWPAKSGQDASGPGSGNSDLYRWAPSVAVGNFSDSAVMAVTTPAALWIPGNERPVFVITALNGDILRRAVASMVNGDKWDQLSGQAAVISPVRETVETVAAPILPVSMTARFGYFASAYPTLA